MKIACLLAADFEDVEFRIPFDRLTDAGHHVVVVGHRKGEKLKGKRGHEAALVEEGIDDVTPAEFDALVIPGGYSPDRLRADERFVNFVREMDDRKKLVAAICHGPQLLLTAGRVAGRTMTAWKTVQGDLARAGARIDDRPVVIDQHLLTSRGPADAERFSDAIVTFLRGTGARNSRQEKRPNT